MISSRQYKAILAMLAGIAVNMAVVHAQTPRSSGKNLAVASAALCLQKARTPTEHAICDDDDLARRDQTLNTAYVQALARSPYQDELRADQRGWLSKRDGCGGDVSCLRPTYAQRILALNAMGNRFQWTGSWAIATLRPDTLFSSLDISKVRPEGFHFSLNAQAGVNQGELHGDARLIDPAHAVYQGTTHSGSTENCTLRFTRVGAAIRLDQKGGDFDCGAGHNVFYDGLYVIAGKNAGSAPVAQAADLFTLGIVSRAQDQAIHRLLGARDYGVLLYTAASVGSAPPDKNGIRVIDMFVPGIACDTKAYILLGRSGELWVGIWQAEDNGGVTLRYYTNVATDKHRIPAIIEANQQACPGDTVHVRMMP